jgi:hypothetical protein
MLEIEYWLGENISFGTGNVKLYDMYEEIM